ncbi:serine/threonine protein kinase, partial [Aetokthonos hydrillicola]|uniref:serine/threonine protein kinase n=1 Tax=Aetokthonos hydrillicola TaxID=1550245 RepID=UPI001ABB19F9
MSWVDFSDFSHRWSKIETLDGGGQGHAYKVESVTSPGEYRFLKVLKDQTNAERRGRMFREAAALSTYSHPSIPRLIESNAHRHNDKSFKLYAVTEWVDGDALSSSNNHPVSIERAVLIIRQLAETLRYVHNLGDGHRDVKPDNVILGHDGQTAYLVDFGLTFNVDRRDAFETGDWQELGNRFLRLPELAPYSPSNRDKRSDLTFLTGLFYFLLFGQVPAVLQDAKGRMPHHRPEIR